MFRGFALLLAVLAFLPLGGAAESVIVPPDRQHAALSLIHFPWQELHYDIVFMSPRRGYRAMTFRTAHRIEIYARPADSVRSVAYDIAHELGHALDLSFNTAETRRRWMTLRGIPAETPWFGCNGCSDYNTPAGDFAETFAVLLLGPQQFRGKIAPLPKESEKEILLSFFSIPALQEK